MLHSLQCPVFMLGAVNVWDVKVVSEQKMLMLSDVKCFPRLLKKIGEKS